jgi:CDP-4-dehydro-6-deoxyglucose reductase
MPDPRFTKPWHGVPREQIPWHPTIDVDACIGCGTCVTGCSRLVYRFDYEHNKPVVADPLNCMVGCTTCANTCPTHAISFPPLEQVLALGREAEVHHAIEDDLSTRREQLEWHELVPHPERRIRLTVERVEDAGPRTRILALAPVGEEDALCQFMPGQYLLLEIPDSGWLARAYSIGNPPRPDGRVELQVRHAADGRFSQWLFERLQGGDTLLARGPAGAFTMRTPRAVPLVFVAGGTGFAPIKAMIESQLALQQDRKMALVWGNSTVADFYELDAIAAWLERDPNLRVVLAVEDPGAGLVAPERAHVVDGRVTEGVGALGVLDGCDAYVAGPGTMIIPAVAALERAGIDRDRMVVDSFGV